MNRKIDMESKHNNAIWDEIKGEERNILKSREMVELYGDQHLDAHVNSIPFSQYLTFSFLFFFFFLPKFDVC